MSPEATATGLLQTEAHRCRPSCTAVCYLLYSHGPSSRRSLSLNSHFPVTDRWNCDVRGLECCRKVRGFVEGSLVWKKGWFGLNLATSGKSNALIGIAYVVILLDVEIIFHAAWLIVDFLPWHLNLELPEAPLIPHPTLMDTQRVYKPWLNKVFHWENNSVPRRGEGEGRLTCHVWIESLDKEFQWYEIGSRWVF